MSSARISLTLHFELLSAATFGRGEGLAGLVDQEIEHDEYGLPYLRGRTLRGLLAEEMESILFALPDQAAKWQTSRDRLLGVEGQMHQEAGILHIGDAYISENLRRLIAISIQKDKSNIITKEDVLASVTAIRRQTAMTHLGAPESASLRALRVVLRGISFASQFEFCKNPTSLDLALLAATVLAWRRAGTGRNRGRGRLKAYLENEGWMRHQFDIFCQGGKQP